jgi:3D (Asp-Asp-Asp) domain-containing protein
MLPSARELEMPLRKRGALCALLTIMIALLASFSEPATDHRGLLVQPEVHLLTAPRTVAVQRAPGPSGPLTLTLRATAYNSLASQTDDSPHITATGATTAFGVIAASRDLLATHLPYGSLVRITDLGGLNDGRGAGAFQEVLDTQQVFIVEDTMHRRKSQQVDIWFPDLSSALSWGVRQVRVEVIRYGRDGIELTPTVAQLDSMPRFLAPGLN